MRRDIQCLIVQTSKKALFRNHKTEHVYKVKHAHDTNKLERMKIMRQYLSNLF